jgi:hypothetical protein
MHCGRGRLSHVHQRRGGYGDQTSNKKPGTPSHKPVASVPLRHIDVRAPQQMVPGEVDKSIVFTSQLPVDHWNEVISDTVIFDAIRDRLEHSALTVNITGPTYRGVKARKLASKKKVA